MQHTMLTEDTLYPVSIRICRAIEEAERLANQEKIAQDYLCMLYQARRAAQSGDRTIIAVAADGLSGLLGPLVLQGHVSARDADKLIAEIWALAEQI